MRVISKGKATGKEFGKVKSKQKLDRIKERKKQINRIENAKRNAERRRDKEKEREEKALISQIEVVDFVKNSYIIEKEGSTEKRVLKVPNELTKENLHKIKDLLTIKVYGKEVSLRQVKLKKGVLQKIVFFIEDSL